MVHSATPTNDIGTIKTADDLAKLWDYKASDPVGTIKRYYNYNKYLATKRDGGFIKT